MLHYVAELPENKICIVVYFSSVILIVFITVVGSFDASYIRILFRHDCRKYLDRSLRYGQKAVRSLQVTKVQSLSNMDGAIV